MNSNSEQSKKKTITYYHPLCDLNLNEFQTSSPDTLLKRFNSEIKVLTYNIFLRSLIKNNENDWKNERLEDFCNILENYDIICLQEMFGTFNSRKQTLIRAATMSGFFFFVDTASPDFTSRYMVDGGLIILSRFPIVSHSYQKYRYGVIADALAEKGLLYAKIAIKNSYLHIFTTHLQASYFDSGENNFIASYETRLDQINQVNNIMAQVLEREYNKFNDKILLLGDLNVDALSYFYKPPISPTCCELVKLEYSQMMNLLNNRNIKSVDLFHHLYKCHPITFADVSNDGSYWETVLTHKEDLGSRQSLDYIFDCYYDEDENDIKKKPLVLENNMSVEKFNLKEIGKIDWYRREYSQLSDHFGLSCSLVLKEQINHNDQILNVKKNDEDSILHINEGNKINKLYSFDEQEESKGLLI